MTTKPSCLKFELFLLYFLLRTSTTPQATETTRANPVSCTYCAVTPLSPICGEMCLSEALFNSLLKTLRQINVGQYTQNNPQESQHIKHEFQGTLYHRFTQDSCLLPDLPNIETKPPTINQTHIYCQSRNIKPYTQKLNNSSQIQQTQTERQMTDISQRHTFYLHIS